MPQLTPPLLLLPLLLAAAAAAPALPSYDVAIADDLGRLRVHACFDGDPPAALYPLDERAVEALVPAGGEASRPRPAGAGGAGIDVTGLAAGGCTDYGVRADSESGLTR